MDTVVLDGVGKPALDAYNRRQVLLCFESANGVQHLCVHINECASSVLMSAKSVYKVCT